MRILISILLLSIASIAHGQVVVISDLPDITKQLQQRCKDITLVHQPSNGPIEALNILLKTPTIKADYTVAMVQEDALVPIERTSPNFLDKFNVLGQASSTFLSLVTTPMMGIDAPRQLKGHRVSIGSALSSSWFSAISIRRTLHVRWFPVEIGQKEALTSLLSGDVDAVLVRGGSIPIDDLVEVYTTPPLTVLLLARSGIILPKSISRCLIKDG